MPNPKDIQSVQVSSNLTLFFKLAFPIFWTVFFGLFAASAFKTNMHEAFGVGPTTFRMLAVLFFLSGVAFLFFTLWQLKRVEIFPEHIYVTDYFKHYKYSFDSIESISFLNLILVKLMFITLAQKGHFGRRIPLIVSRKRLKKFKKAYPERSQKLGL